LFSLIKLTETTAVLFENEKNDPSSCRAVPASWRVVWKTLFQPDLRYAEYTGIASENSIGEMVLILLTEMIRRGCTDNVGGKQKMQFVYDNQHNIWHLPLFKDKIDSTPVSRSPFELISSIIQFVGLFEPQVREVSGMFPSNTRSLRHCLVVQSLCCMNDVMLNTNKTFSEETSRRALVSAIAKCLLGLSTGESLQLNHLSSQDSRFQAAIDSSFAISPDTNIHHLDFSGSQSINTACLCILWNSFAAEIKEPPCFSLSGLYRHEYDLPILISRRLRNILYKKELALSSTVSNFVAENESKELRNDVISFIYRN
jgi:hypothetical protein